MASIGTDEGGYRRILFSAPDGKRKTIRLGKASMRQAEAFRVRVELLLHSNCVGHAPDPETAGWLAGLDEVMRDRLARAGIVKPAAHCNTTSQAQRPNTMSAARAG